MRKVYRFRIVEVALLMLAGAPSVVAACMWILLQRPDHPPVWILSLAGIAFFGGTFLLGLYSLPPIIRDSEAVTLPPEALPLRQVGSKQQTAISWTERAGFPEQHIKSFPFIILHLHTPASHIARERHTLRHTLMKLNTRYAGSSYTTRCKAVELLGTLLHYLETYGQNPAKGDNKH